MTQETGRREPTRPDADEVVDAVFSVDTRIVRTLTDTAVRTNSVIAAALGGDKTLYISPLKVLLTLFGLQLTFFALIGLPYGGDVALFTEGVDPEVLAGWYAEEGVTPEAFMAASDRWNSLSLWPATILGSAPFIILFKLYRPSLTLYGHALVYIVTTNAAALVMLAVMIFVFIDESAILWALGASMLYWLFVLGRALIRFYASSGLGMTLKLGGALLLLPFTYIIMLVVMFAIIEAGVRLETGASFLSLLAFTSGAPS